jgi:TolB-like protein
LIVAFGTCRAAGKQTVAVLDFESIGSEEHLGKAISEIMRTELVGTDRFRVVERAQIRQALQEQALQVSGATDTQNAVKIGKLLGADLIVVGSVVKIGNSYTVNSRMIDVKTGEAQLGRNATGTDLNLLTGLSRELIDGLFGTVKNRDHGKTRAATPPTPLPPVISPRHPGSAISASTTWDFETGDLRGWKMRGDAFRSQPTFGDNPTARQRGQPSNHQGNYWIGTFENRPSPTSPPGAIQGDGPQGELISAPFLIESATISFLIGGGCEVDRTYIELRVEDRPAMRAIGACSETMQRVRWEVGHLRERQATIHIVDRSSEGWGHINVDDFRFE